MSAGRCLIDRARLTRLAAAAFAQIDGRADAAHPAALQPAERRAVGRAVADRIGPLATLVASVNAPHAFFESEVPQLKDDQFAAWPGLQPRGPCVF